MYFGKASSSAWLVWLIVGVLIFLALLWWFTSGGKQLGGIKIGDNAQTATADGGQQDGGTPSGITYPDANDPVPMVGETERNGGLDGGEVGGGSEGSGFVGGNLYLSHDQSVDVEERDRDEVWGENLASVIQVSGPELDVYILDPGTNPFGNRLLEVSLDNEYISTYYQGDGDTLRGWAAKFRITMPNPGRFFVYDEKKSGMNDRFAWLIEWR